MCFFILFLSKSFCGNLFVNALISTSIPDKNIRYVKPNRERKSNQGMASVLSISPRNDFPIIIPHMISPTIAGIRILDFFENHVVSIGIIKANTDIKNSGSNCVSACVLKIPSLYIIVLDDF